MTLSKITHIVCYDDHRSFTGDIRNRFRESRYIVNSFHNKKEFIEFCVTTADNKCSTVAILGFTEPEEKINLLNDFITSVKNVLPDAAVIILVPPGKLEAVKKGIAHIVDGLIPINNNTILRIHNTIKRVFSEYRINIFRKRRNNAVIITILVLLALIATFFVLYARYPSYF